MVADILAAIERAIAWIANNGAFSFNARDIVDLSHYRLNGDERNFACPPFLERIAGHLFEGDPSRTALVSGKRRISYGELGQMVAGAMAGLKARGIGRGDVVAVCLPRSPEHTAITLAVALMGAVWVPVDAGSPEDRLRYLLTNCRPAIIVARSVPQGFDAVDPAALLSAPAPAGAPVDAESFDKLLEGLKLDFEAIDDPNNKPPGPGAPTTQPQSQTEQTPPPPLGETAPVEGGTPSQGANQPTPPSEPSQEPPATSTPE